MICSYEERRTREDRVAAWQGAILGLLMLLAILGTGVWYVAGIVAALSAFGGPR